MIVVGMFDSMFERTARPLLIRGTVNVFDRGCIRAGRQATDELALIYRVACQTSTHLVQAQYRSN